MPSIAAAPRIGATPPLKPIKSSRLKLRANLAGRMRGTVDVHVQVAGLEAGELLIGEFRTRRPRPGSARALGQRDDRRAGHSRRAHVDVRHRAVDAGRLDSAADRLIGSDRYRAAA